MFTNNKVARIAIDIIIIVTMIGCLVSTDTAKTRRGHYSVEHNFSWTTLHSIVSIAFTLLLIVHIWQHRKFIIGIFKKRLYTRNKVTTITLLAFILTLSSFILFLSGYNSYLEEFHSTAASIFLLTACVHFILNFRKMLILFRGTLFRNDSWIYNYASRNA